ncbi:MAG: hypothetical protein ACRBB6_05260 [Neptuniibacter sp.]
MTSVSSDHNLFISCIRLLGVCLMVSVGYNYINSDLGFSIAQSIAIGLFGLFLTEISQGYELSLRSSVGWVFIDQGCLVISWIDDWS